MAARMESGNFTGVVTNDAEVAGGRSGGWTSVAPLHKQDLSDHVRRRQRRCREVERVRCSADDGLERWFVVADLPSPGRGRVCCSHVLQHRQSCVWICCTALAFHFYTSGVCLSAYQSADHSGEALG